VTNALFLKRYDPRTEEQIEEEKLLSSEELVTDPICGMKIMPINAIEYQYKGETFYFCNPNCEVEFKRDPEKYKNYDNIDPKLMHKQMEKKEELVVDPVCGMKGKPEDWIEHEYKNKKYYFCNDSCLVEFKKNPDKYIESKEEKEITKPKKDDEQKMTDLKCSNCGNELESIPMHCGKPMTLNKEKNQLECWMGPECGKIPLNELKCSNCS
jgi:YHS domain-containing protein